MNPLEKVLIKWQISFFRRRNNTGAKPMVLLLMNMQKSKKLSQRGIESSGGLRCWCTTILMLMEPIKSNYSCLAPSHQEHRWILMHGNSATSLHQSNNTVTGGASLNGDWSWGLARFKVSWMRAFSPHTPLCSTIRSGREEGFVEVIFFLSPPASWRAKFNQHLYVSL